MNWMVLETPTATEWSLLGPAISATSICVSAMPWLRVQASGGDREMTAEPPLVLTQILCKWQDSRVRAQGKHVC
jgi:hypothetical protein